LKTLIYHCYFRRADLAKSGGVSWTYHENISKVDKHDRISILPPTGDIQTHRGNRLGSTALDEIQTHCEFEYLAARL
jgi:hypothetical protein